MQPGIIIALCCGLLGVFLGFLPFLGSNQAQDHRAAPGLLRDQNALVASAADESASMRFSSIKPGLVQPAWKEKDKNCH